jgi:AcrR family transcriptional regulator
VTTEAPESPERPLRADAARNRELVLAAAREAFAEGGPDVAVREIARRAGVGPGTLFRHFPTKRDLLVAVLDEAFAAMAASVDEALAIDDPWDGLVHVLTSTAELQARDRTVLEAVGPELYGDEHFRLRLDGMQDGMRRLVERAQEAGVVRADLTVEDVPFVVAALGGATEYCTPLRGGCSPGLWRRYLGLVLDGLRPEGAHPLSGPPPTHEQLLAVKTAKVSTRRVPARG